MSLDSISSLIARLRRGPSVRERFVDSHLAKGIAYQIRATRDRLGWSQIELGKRVGMNQNAISRLESSERGKPTITTLKRLAVAFDVGLIVRFVPFSEMVHWISGTPYQNKGLSTESLAVPTFKMEEDGGILDFIISPKTVEHVDSITNLSEANIRLASESTGPMQATLPYDRRLSEVTSNNDAASETRALGSTLMTSIADLDATHDQYRVITK